MKLNPYLYFNGDCKAAFTFYEKCLKGTNLVLMTHAGTPAEATTAPEWLDKIIHARLTVGDVLLMGSDAPTEHFKTPQGFSVTLGFDDPAEAERVYNALLEKGIATMPLAETFWAKKFGMLIDQFGTPWMINCENRPA